MPQSQYKSQEDLYRAQREERDRKQKSKDAPTFQSAPMSELVKASNAARKPLPSRKVGSGKGELVPASLRSLLGRYHAAE